MFNELKYFTNVKSGYDAFQNCTNLIELDVRNYTKQERGGNEVRGCSKLDHIVWHNLTQWGGYWYIGLSSLRYCVYLQSTYPTTIANQWGYYGSQSPYFPFYVNDLIYDQLMADSNITQSVKNHMKKLSTFPTDFPDDVLPS